MYKSLKFPIIICLLVACAIYSEVAYAGAARDGFQAARTIKSRYFTIYIENGVDLQNLTMMLSVPPSIKTIIRKPAPFADSYTLPDQLDTLFLAVSEIMDIRLNEFTCNLKICRDASRISAIANTLFGMQIQKPGGFYVVAIDTLYVDAESITINVLGHELSHAIQRHYFVVPPPEKLQEVLAGYVEYQLRKYTNTLPQRTKNE